MSVYCKKYVVRTVLFIHSHSTDMVVTSTTYLLQYANNIIFSLIIFLKHCTGFARYSSCPYRKILVLVKRVGGFIASMRRESLRAENAIENVHKVT